MCCIAQVDKPAMLLLYVHAADNVGRAGSFMQLLALLSMILEHQQLEA